MASLLPRQPALRDAAGRLLPVRRRAARPRDRSGSSPAKRPWQRKREMLGEIWQQGPPPDAQGLRAVPGARRARRFPLVLAGNATANLTRNLWAFMIIFCGHFPDGTQEFTEEEAEGETRGQLVFPPAARLGQPDRRQALPHHVGQPQPPDRAPPVPRHSGPSLRRDLGRGPGDLRALRDPLQLGPADASSSAASSARSPGWRCRTDSGAARERRGQCLPLPAARPASPSPPRAPWR